MREISIFTVYENGEEVFIGNREEVAEKFQISKRSVYSYAYNDRKLYGKYRIKTTGKQEAIVKRKEHYRPRNQKPPEPEKDYSNDKFNTLVWHLKTFGNTSVSFDPVRYLPDLYDLGLDCRVKEIPSYVEEKRVTKRGRKPKVKYNYLVEVV